MVCPQVRPRRTDASLESHTGHRTLAMSSVLPTLEAVLRCLPVAGRPSAPVSLTGSRDDRYRLWHSTSCVRREPMGSSRMKLARTESASSVDPIVSSTKRCHAEGEVSPDLSRAVCA